MEKLLKLIKEQALSKAKEDLLRYESVVIIVRGDDSTMYHPVLKFYSSDLLYTTHDVKRLLNLLNYPYSDDYKYFIIHHDNYAEMLDNAILSLLYLDDFPAFNYTYEMAMELSKKISLCLY